MAEPYSIEHDNAAQNILAKALEELLAAGLGHVEACHALVHQGIDLLPAFCCRDCLPPELEAIVEATEDRIAGVPGLVAGVDCALGPCGRH